MIDTGSITNVSFRKNGIIAFGVRLSSEVFDSTRIVLVNNDTLEIIPLREKTRDKDRRYLQISFSIKQIFYNFNQLDGSRWIICAESIFKGEKRLFNLSKKLKNTVSRLVGIDGILFRVTLNSKGILLNMDKNIGRSIINNFRIYLEWSKFKIKYLSKKSVMYSPCSKSLNILYVPWIERTANSLIEIIAKNTSLNFIPFKFYKNTSEDIVRSGIIKYCRENKTRIKQELKRHLENYYLGKITAIVVTLDWTPPIRLLIEAANELGIPTVLIPHESVFANEKLFYTDHNTGINTPNSKYVLAWGNLQKRIFIERGYPCEQIFCVGTPKFDVYKDFSPTISKEEFFAKAKLEYKPTILFALQPLDSQFEESKARSAQIALIRDLIRICQEDDYQLILRLPPALGHKVIDQNLKEELIKYRFIYLEGMDSPPSSPMDAIYHTDLTISINSTMLFEAALLNRPSISAKYVEFDSFWDNVGIPSVSNYIQAKRAINELIGTKKRSTTEEGWKWACQNLSNGEFGFNASKNIEKWMMQNFVNRV